MRIQVITLRAQTAFIPRYGFRGWIMCVNLFFFMHQIIEFKFGWPHNDKGVYTRCLICRGYYR